MNAPSWFGPAREVRVDVRAASARPAGARARTSSRGTCPRAGSPACGAGSRCAPPRSRRGSSPTGVQGAITGSGDSPWRPYSAASRSAASVFVGIPVDGPARCTSITTSGSSIATASPIVSAFRSMPGPARGGHAELAREGGAERHVDRRDLVLGLDRAHAEAAVARERVQQLGGGRDRVAGVEEPEARLHAGGDQAVRERLGAVDVAVDAGRRRRGRHLVGDRDQLRGLAEVVARPERGQVGVAHRRRRPRTSSRSSRRSARSGART